MNETNNPLKDIELPPTDFTVYILILLVVLSVILFLLLGSCWFKRRKPLFRATRQLRHLSDENPDPNNLATILRDGLQVQKLVDANLPDEFLKRLNEACFSSQPCSPEEYAALKTEVKALLEKNE